MDRALGNPLGNPLGLARVAGSSAQSTLYPGDPFGGGYYVDSFLYGEDLYALVIAPKSAESIQFFSSGGSYDPSKPNSVDGMLNTLWMTSPQPNKYLTYPGATYCRNYRGGGFDDWFLPSPTELFACFVPFKPSNYAAAISYTMLPSVLPRPSTIQNSTSVTRIDAFKATGPEAFDTDTNGYLTSVGQNNDTGHTAITFYNGTSVNGNPGVAKRTRPMRKVLIEKDFWSRYTA